MGAVGATLNVERLIALAAPQTIRSSSLQASQAGPTPLLLLCSPHPASELGHVTLQAARRLHVWALQEKTSLGALGALCGSTVGDPAQHPYGCCSMVCVRAQAEVLVCAKGGGGLLKERKALAAMLWEAGVKAELVHAAAPSQTFQYEWAAARSIHWLVTINAVTFSTTDTVQVGSHSTRMPRPRLFVGIRPNPLGRGLHIAAHACCSSLSAYRGK